MAEQYMFSFYFIVQTITTVGYGDMTVRTSWERMFCV
jgi:hypothetical protein